MSCTDVEPVKSDLYRLDVIANIAGSSNGYSKMVTFLLADEKGTKKEILDRDHRNVNEKVEKMFHQWGDGEGSRPVTWATLVRCLRDSRLHTLADKIESAYCAEVGGDNSHEQRDVEGAEQTLPAHTSQSSMDSGHGSGPSAATQTPK